MKAHEPTCDCSVCEDDRTPLPANDVRLVHEARGALLAALDALDGVHRALLRASDALDGTTSNVGRLADFCMGVSSAEDAVLRVQLTVRAALEPTLTAAQLGAKS